VVSQSVKTTGAGGKARGDGAKKVKGRKRRLLLVERKSSTYHPTRFSRQLRKEFLGSWSILGSGSFGRMGFYGVGQNH
jgi:hypothetical protein